jgi:hypothetical protein
MPTDTSGIKKGTFSFWEPIVSFAIIGDVELRSLFILFI